MSQRDEQCQAIVILVVPPSAGHKVDEDPSDPFDFSIEHWNEQLVAGYSKNTPNRGLKAHMPDHNDLNRRTAASRPR